MKLPRQARLSGAEQFGAVFAKPEVSRDASFKVLSRPNGLPYSRLGMAVSRQVSRSAVGRNRLKRLIRESFRHHQAEFTDSVARDFVVLPSRGAATISNARLYESLTTHWRKQLRFAQNAAEHQGGHREPRGK